MSGYSHIIPKCYLAIAVVAFLAIGCGHKGGNKRAAKGADTVSVADLLQKIDLAEVSKVDTVDFGVVKTGEVVSRQLALTNGASAPLVITSTNTSCGCLKLDYLDKPISSGEKMVVTMWFDSAGYTFFYPRAFYVQGSMEGGEKKIVVVAEME